MTDAELIIAVRARCGKVTSGMGELDDADITREGGWILKKIAERITVKCHRYITSVANQREYDVADETLRVQELFPTGSVDTDMLNDPEMTGYTVDENAIEEYNWPSLYMIRKERQLKGLPDIRGSFDPIRRKLAIDPYPETAGDKYWYTSIEKTRWTLAAVPEDFEGLVVLGTSWRGLETIALKRSTLGGVHRDGGFINYPEERLKKFIDSWRDEFYDDLRLKAKLYMT